MTEIVTEEELLRVKEIILSTADNAVPVISECLKSVVESGGKLLRPRFLLLAAKIGNPDSEKICRLAAGIELLHISSLIHDDIIDNSDFRRGSPSTHKIYGVKKSVLIGDYFFSKSISLLAENRNIINGDAAARTAGRICESEIVQINNSRIKDFRLRTYLRHITGKTAALFILSFHLGALESGCSINMQSVLRKIGYNIGVAFQIIDDILDYTGNENNVGKPVGNDLKNGIITAPVIFAVQKDSTISGLLNRKKAPGKRIVNKIIDRAGKLGAIADARELASVYTKRALNELTYLPDGNAKNELEILIKKLLVRAY